MPDESAEVHNVDSAATYARRHPKTLLGALRRGELVGYQARAGCTWRIFQRDLDAWIRGEKPSRRRRAA